LKTNACVEKYSTDHVLLLGHRVQVYEKVLVNEVVVFGDV
jgi:hypothetical protein